MRERGRLWTQREEADLIKLVGRGLTDQDIGRVLSRTPRAISVKRSKMDILVDKRLWSLEDKYLLVSLVRSGATADEISKKLGVSKIRIRDKLRTVDVSLSKEWPKCDVDQLKALWEGCVHVNEISKKMGRSVYSIYHKVAAMKLKRVGRAKIMYVSPLSLGSLEKTTGFSLYLLHKAAIQKGLPLTNGALRTEADANTLITFLVDRDTVRSSLYDTKRLADLLDVDPDLNEDLISEHLQRMGPTVRDFPVRTATRWMIPHTYCTRHYRIDSTDISDVLNDLRETLSAYWDQKEQRRKRAGNYALTPSPTEHASVAY